MKYKQNEPYGCALYAVANALELDNYVKPERVEQSKKGLLTPHLSKWLQEDGYNWGIEVWYYDHEGGKIPTKFFEKYRPLESDALPVLISVKNEGSLNHVISGQIHKDGSIKVFDSLKQDALIIPFEEVNTLYDHVNGLYCFVDMDTPQHYIQLWNS